MNSYLDFLDKVRESLPDYLPAEYADAEIQVRRTEKHLSDSYDGICFKPSDSDIGICMNLSHIYENVDSHDEFSSAMRVIASDILDAIEGQPAELRAITQDIDYFIEHLAVQLVNVSTIENIRDEIPFRVRDDIAMIYRLVLPQSEDDILTSVVTSPLIRSFGLNEEELFKKVMDVLPGNVPAAFDKLCDEVFIASCAIGQMGAGCLFYPDFPEKAGEFIGSNFYILPFAVHSLLLIKDIGNLSREFMEDVAFQFSTFGTCPEDRLSKEIYYCNISDGTIERAM